MGPIEDGLRTGHTFRVRPSGVASREVLFPGGGGGCLGVGEGLVDELEEFGAVDDFDEGGAFGVGGGDPDGRGVFDADALAEGVVGFDEGGEVALGVDGEGQDDLVIVCELLRELAQDIERGDVGLVGEDGVAVFIADLLGLGVKPAGIDGCLEAPGVEGQREVVADPGDVVLGGGLFEQRVGAGAVGALHVFEFDDGDAGSGGWLEGGGIVDLGGGRRGRAAELGMGGRGRNDGQRERGSGEDGGAEKRYAVHRLLDVVLGVIVTVRGERTGVKCGV